MPFHELVSIHSLINLLNYLCIIPQQGSRGEAAAESSEEICVLSCCWLSLMHLEHSKTILDKALTPVPIIYENIFLNS